MLTFILSEHWTEWILVKKPLPKHRHSALGRFSQPAAVVPERKLTGKPPLTVPTQAAQSQELAMLPFPKFLVSSSL